jgi:hypothetical protein
MLADEAGTDCRWAISISGLSGPMPANHTDAPSRQLARRILLGFVLAGLVGGYMVFGDPPTATAQGAVHDVALHQTGVLRGLVVDGQGASTSDVEVALVQRGKVVATTRSAIDGSFAVSGLQGGVYQVSTRGGVGTLRLWAPHTAPPVAEDEVLLIHNAPLAAEPLSAATAPRGGTIFRAVTHPWVLGGVAAAAIAVPLSLDDDDDAS